MDNVILYGAGKRGKTTLEFITSNYSNINVIAFADLRADYIKELNGIKVLPINELPFDVPVIICIADKEVTVNVYNTLNNMGIKCYYNASDYMHQVQNVDQIEFNRNYCAYHHIDGMNDYFDKYDNEEGLSVFWDEESIFYKSFMKLDLTNVIELACGRGRHVQKYIDKAENITLVDILEKNIQICQERFKDKPNVSYYKNNGVDFSELQNDTYTSLFTYDAMVHFQMFDVYSYLKETFRVLKSGSYALFHHSNNDKDYTAVFMNNAQGRCFMSKNLFAYLAHTVGFEIVEQNVIDWGKAKELDCISLVRKP